MLFRSLLGLATIVAATPFSTNDPAKALETRAGGKLSPKEFENLKFYIQHAAAAYCNYNAAPGKQIICSGKDTCPLVMKNKATVVASVVGKKTELGAYIAIDAVNKEIVLSIRGSSTVANWKADFDFAARDCDFTKGCKVHSGFAKAWDEIKDSMTAAMKATYKQNPDYKLVIVGHSLGGAVATIGAAYLRRDGLPVEMYTYGSPRVGNDKFAEWFSSQPGGKWRVTHANDVVPRLPPMDVLGLNYRHITPEYWVTDGSMLNSDFTKTSYTIDQVNICHGIGSTECNASSKTFSIISHIFYLGRTGGCTPHEILPNALADTISDIVGAVVFK